MFLGSMALFDRSVCECMHGRASLVLWCAVMSNPRALAAATPPTRAGLHSSCESRMSATNVSVFVLMCVHANVSGMMTSMTRRMPLTTCLASMCAGATSWCCTTRQRRWRSAWTRRPRRPRSLICARAMGCPRQKQNERRVCGGAPSPTDIFVLTLPRSDPPTLQG